jgi:hypothetical protein
MSNKAKNPSRTFRGGVNRAIRVITGTFLVWYAEKHLVMLLDHASPDYDANLPAANAAILAAVSGIALVAGLFLLKGTIARMCGVLLTFGMVIPVLAGYGLMNVGLPQALCRVPLALLLVGVVIMYTGQGEWTLVPFALHQCREGWIKPPPV